MHKTTKTFIILITTVSFLHSTSLSSKYKEIMSATSTQATLENNIKDRPEPNTQQNYNLAEQVKKIQELKQGTFESTNDFNSRVNSKIKVLQNEIKFFAKDGLKEYSAGTATMKNYDPDREKMELTLKWNDDLKPIFPETKDLKTVSLNISKQEAKALFGKQRTHYFHIDLTYNNSKLNISQITLNNKYKIKKLKTKSITRLASNNKTTSDYHTNNIEEKINNVLILNWYHPSSEPKQLYIVDFKYNGKIKKYRVYCPTGMVRDITRKWKKARKAYSEDKIRYRNKKVLREVFKSICQ